MARFIGLEKSPPGFFYDEATGAAHSLCYQQTGRDLFGQRDLFSRVDFSGFQSAPFILGGALWTSVFGTDFAGFRSFVAFIGVLTVLGVYLLVRRVVQNRDVALWAAALAACLPWAFHFSRISWDAPLGVALLVWALVLAYHRPAANTFTKGDWAAWAGAGLLFTLASYTYSPMRIQSGLMLLLLPSVRWQPRLLMLIIFGVGSLPVLANYADPEFASRAELLALTSDDPRNPYREAGVWGMFLGYVSQVFGHLSPRFLLLSGDMNVRHSIQSHGMLDWFTFVGLLAGLMFAAVNLANPRRLIQGQASLFSLAIIGIFAGITSAALTWDSIPHALRSLGAWPFITILAGYGVWKVLRNVPVQLVGCAVIVVLFGSYLYSYFIEYPQIAQWWFDAEIVTRIQSEGEFPDHYLPVVRSYYQMTEFGMSCIEVRTAMEGS